MISWAWVRGIAKICLFVGSSIAGLSQLTSNLDPLEKTRRWEESVGTLKTSGLFERPNGVKDKPIRDRLELADDHYRAGKIAECEAVLRNATHDFPESAPTFVSFGRFLYAQKRYAEAEQSYQSALRLDPAPYVYVDLGTLSAEGLNRPLVALDYFYKALEKEPDNAGAHYAAGQLLTKLDQREQGREELEKAARLEPQNPLPWVALARLSVQERKAKSAIEEYSKALDLAPGNTVIGLELADAYSALRRDEDALRLYQSVLDKDVGSFGAWTKLGMFYQSRNKLTDADRCYGEALKINPASALVLNNRASLCLREGGDFKKGISLSLQAVKIKPTDPDYLDTLGLLFQRAGQFSEAVEMFKKAVSSDPQFAAVQYHLAVALNSLGKTDEAEHSLHAALTSQSAFSERKEAESLLAKISKAGAR